MARCFCPCHTHPGTYPPPCGVCGHDTREGRMVGGYRDGWEPSKSEPYKEGYMEAVEQLAQLRGDYIELQRRAIAVTRIWDMLARCSDEFEPDDMAACGEYRDNLDEAIIGLMKMADRPMWERREQEMKEAAERSLNPS